MFCNLAEKFCWQQLLLAKSFNSLGIWLLHNLPVNIPITRYFIWYSYNAVFSVLIMYTLQCNKMIQILLSSFSNGSTGAINTVSGTTEDENSTTPGEDFLFLYLITPWFQSFNELNRSTRNTLSRSYIFYKNKNKIRTTTYQCNFIYSTKKIFESHLCLQSTPKSSAAVPNEESGGKTSDDEEDSCRYNYSFFHFIFLLAILFTMMTITHWISWGIHMDFVFCFFVFFYFNNHY